MRNILTALMAVTMTTTAFAQAPQKAAPQTPPIQATAYRPVTITLPTDMTDPAFAVLRKQLAEAAAKRDAAAVSRLVVGNGFFWLRDKTDAASKKRSGYENLSSALGLGSKTSVGWDMLTGFADETSASASHAQKGAFCAPAEPGYDPAAFERMLKATQTDASAWGYAVSSGIDVRAAPGTSTPAVEKLGLHFVRVMPEAKPVSPAFQRIVTPTGKTGYVSIDVIAPFGNDQLCYVKEAGAWKIGGYIGGGEPQ